ncbi:transposable element Tcb2 transposase [Trichonephila clavipes]|nr:transposable element Tcb2 transposase [Trichonephila clavipes]
MFPYQHNVLRKWEDTCVKKTEQWTREGTHAQETGSGVTRKTTRREVRRIVRQALVNPTVTRSTIRADVGVAIVPQTISRHLAEANFKSKRPFRALPVTPEHRQLRLQWCPGQFPVECHRLPKGNDIRSTLIVMRGTLTGQCYVDDILRPHLGPFLNGLPGQACSKSCSRLPTSFSNSSPDLTPVEHVWDQLKQHMSSCHSVHDLELAVQDLWAHQTQDNIRCLINSMPDRVEACIAAGGGPTRY